MEPLPSSNYTVDVGHVQIADSAVERGGLQPVVCLKANGSKCARVKAREAVRFAAEAEVPDKARSLTFVEWSLKGVYSAFGSNVLWIVHLGGEDKTIIKEKENAV